MTSGYNCEGQESTTYNPPYPQPGSLYSVDLATGLGTYMGLIDGSEAPDYPRMLDIAIQP